jgi:hypothetical protein
LVCDIPPMGTGKSINFFYSVCIFIHRAFHTLYYIECPGNKMAFSWETYGEKGGGGAATGSERERQNGESCFKKSHTTAGAHSRALEHDG